MKLITGQYLNCLVFSVIGTLLISLTNQNSNSAATENAFSASAKTSIFESFNKKQFQVVLKKPANPFDPAGKPFELKSSDLDANPDSAFAGNGEVDLGTGPVFYKGWVKFFRYLFDDKSKSPKAFYENPEFNDQLKGLKNYGQLEEQDDGMYKYVHSKNDFYAIAYAEEITFAKSKINAFGTIFDTLKIDYINPVSEDKGYKGGLTNMGSFKEGDCFKVSTSKAGRWNWVICTENSSEKIKLMTIIKKLVIKRQRQNGFVNVGNDPTKNPPSAPGAKNSTTLAGATLDQSNLSVSLDKNINDGYWIVLQDWSSCTKFCGSGTQTLHRMCVPPKKGGNPCQGQAVVTRMCNEQPCPGTNQIIDPESKEAEIEVLKPKMSVLPFSDRPQRYDKCFLKESDLLLTIENDYDPDKKKGAKVKAVQIPVRVVMNQYTISAFAGLNETDRKVSFDIKKVSFYTSIRDPTCFILKEYGVPHAPMSKTGSLGEKAPISEAEFCPFATSSPEIKEEWDYDFHLFKHQCHESKKLTALLLNNTEIEEELSKKKGQMRIDMVNEKKKKLLAKTEDSGATVYAKKVKENSLKAIEKEVKLEQMIENEIKEAQNEAIEMKAKELEKEKTKLDCLNKAIKERELENEYNVAQSATEDRIEGLKKQVAETISTKRQRLKSKIARLKKMSSSQLKNMEAQIMNVRLEMVNSLSTKNSFNPEKCRVMVLAKTEDEYQRQKKTYCDERMATDPQDHRRCVSAERNDVIALCCDYETDPSIPDDYKKCVSQAKQNLPESQDDVRFFWGKPYHREDTERAKNEFINQLTSESVSSSAVSSSEMHFQSSSHHSESHSSSFSQQSSSGGSMSVSG